MPRFKKRWTGSTTDEIIIAKANKSTSRYGNVGAIKKILVNNGHHTYTTRVRLYLDDGTDEYNLTTTDVPPLSGFVLTDNISYNGSIYDLKATLSEAGYNITIIIK